MFTRIFIIFFIFFFSCPLGYGNDFLVLKSSEVNMRYGPGRLYPIKWVYCKKDMPVEVFDEFENWVYVKDIDDEYGWILYSMLSKKHIKAIVIKQSFIKKTKKQTSKNTAEIERLALVRVKRCVKDMCAIEFNKIKGWIAKESLWAVPKKVKQL